MCTAAWGPGPGRHVAESRLGQEPQPFPPSVPTRLLTQACQPPRGARLRLHLLPTIPGVSAGAGPAQRGCWAPAPGSWPLGQGEAGARPERLQPGSRELLRQHAAPSQMPGMSGASALGSGPTGPSWGRGRDRPGAGGFSQGPVGGNTPGGPSGAVSGASKPKSLWGRVPLDQSAAAPGVCMRVDCWDPPWEALQLDGGHGGRGCLHWAPLLMFTCVSGSGVPAWCPPKSLRSPSEEDRVLVPPRMPHAPPAAAGHTWWPRIPATRPSHAHPPRGRRALFIRRRVPPGPARAP